MNEIKQRSFLKWAGGKFSTVDKIKPFLPQADYFIEPFVGAGTVFLNTDYKHYILNDINSDLINLYKILQKNHTEYIKDARELFAPKYNTEEQFYKLREDFNQSKDDYERSVIFLYLNKFGFNGLCRYSKKGNFNVPFGKYKQVGFNEEGIINFAKKAKNATFYCEDFANIFELAPKNSVIYCDPPYVPLNDTAFFTSYHVGGFGIGQQEKLAQVAHATAISNQSTVLISNHDLPQVRSLYKNAHIESFLVKRLISSNGGRPNVGELLAIFKPSSL